MGPGAEKSFLPSTPGSEGGSTHSQFCCHQQACPCGSGALCFCDQRRLIEHDGPCDLKLMSAVVMMQAEPPSHTAREGLATCGSHPAPAQPGTAIGHAVLATLFHSLPTFSRPMHVLPLHLKQSPLQLSNARWTPPTPRGCYLLETFLKASCDDSGMRQQHPNSLCSMRLRPLTPSVIPITSE